MDRFLVSIVFSSRLEEQEDRKLGKCVSTDGISLGWNKGGVT